VLTIRFRKGETSLRLFTTIATLGTAHGVTLQEIRIECFFPADAESAALMRGWA
jgi:MmyB-like transcription regulator ligand binding domain